MTKVVVVGNGMVGSRFVEDLLAADRAGRHRVTVLGAEDREPYNRVLLSEVIAGRYDLASLTLPAPTDSRVAVLRGTTAVSVDREDRVVESADGSRHRYDVLVLATGAAARIPPLAGLRPDPGGLPAASTPCGPSTTPGRSSRRPSTPVAPSSWAPVSSASRRPVAWLPGASP